MKKRLLAQQILSVAMKVSSAMMMWTGLKVITNCESPATVVISNSMAPFFMRGDLLFLSNYQEAISVGDIVVFKIEGRDIPIVHRVLKLHEKLDGSAKFLTKGDDNSVDDRGLYAPGQLWLESKDVVGRVRGYLPYVGYVTIVLNEFPKLKFAFLSSLVLYDDMSNHHLGLLLLPSYVII